MGWRALLFGLILLLGGSSSVVVAQTAFEKLVSPGPLSRPHAPLEKDCGACHRAFTPSAENGQCLACHKPIAADVRGKDGFHGRSPRVAARECRACHVEHKGRGFSIASFKPGSLNHDQTDFALRGAHRRVTCRGCHEAGDKFRQAPKTCAACHAADDVHRGRLGKDCASCHVETDWREIRRFDHSKTGFPLVGNHQRAACASCHVGQRWEGTPRNCVACHKEDDVHQGSRGPSCESCHTPIGWKAVTFDHDTDTNFPLEGRHEAVACEACHGSRRERPKPPQDCVACHKEDDVHGGNLGPDCASCHSPASWTATAFDHDRRTRFPLRGAHRRIDCQACHTRPVTEFKPPMTCVACHADDEPHQGRLGPKCENCHEPESWKGSARFDHGLTRFPLFGQHGQLDCTQCHRDLTFTAAGTQCYQCHEDSWHIGRFGTPLECSACHRPVGWKAWRFDHDRQTRFPLTGRHAELTCHSCHAQPARTAELPVDCFACHKTDDVHEGRFGTRCGDCHGGDSFKAATIPFEGRRLPISEARASPLGRSCAPWRPPYRLEAVGLGGTVCVAHPWFESGPLMVRGAT